jgi:hypothetical protein
MPKRRRKRCPYCQDLFWPDPRTATRQRCCVKSACQVERRKATQKRWRSEHPDDATARRYRAAIAAAKAGETPSLPRAPPARIEAFPWAEARDEISGQAFVTLRFFGFFAATLARDVIRTEVPKIMGETRPYGADGAKDETAPAAPGE